MIDTKNVRLPVWAWHYFATGNAFQIAHVVKKFGDGFLTDKLYFLKVGKEFSGVEEQTQIEGYEFAKYNYMNTFSEKHEAIRTIFISSI
jgi:hypothetical protein